LVGAKRKRDPIENKENKKELIVVSHWVYLWGGHFWRRTRFTRPAETLSQPDSYQTILVKALGLQTSTTRAATLCISRIKFELIAMVKRLIELLEQLDA
jgi:hypothetical protein